MPRRPKRPVPPELIADILALEKREENLLRAAKAAHADLQTWHELAQFCEGCETCQITLPALRAAIAAYEEEEGQP